MKRGKKQLPAELAMKLLIDDYEAELKALAEKAVEIKVLIAFLTEDGLTWLPKKKYPISRFIVGLDLGITTVKALKTLHNGGAKVRVFHDTKRLFHPKVVYVRTAKSEHLIVGSNNLTFGGIRSNYEVSTLSERNAHNNGAFSDFLALFNDLSSHDCCYPANAKNYRIYSKYAEAKIQSQLSAKIPLLFLGPKVGSKKRNPSINPSRLATLGDSLRWIASEFPHLDRHQGDKIAHHPLKRFNEKKLRPLFAEIVKKVSKASGRRLEAWSSLNQGGNWRQIPIIQALDEQRETWENVDDCGRAALQVHFSRPDCTRVWFSLVLQYNVDISIKDGQMPKPVKQKFDRMLAHLKDYRPDAAKGLPCFKVWDFRKGKDKDSLWSQPLLSYEYDTESLPPDKQLCIRLKSLATALIDAP
jgi:HKD family nuclease